ncbi:MAG: protein-disulfide reductase DsbD domain-containing protein, partial [Pseudohongiellaceae bacterium]
LTAQFNIHDGKVNVMVAAGEALFTEVSEVVFFPEQDRVMKLAPYREVLIEDQRLQVSVEQHRRLPADLTEFSGVLAIRNNDESWRAFALSPHKTRTAWQERVEVELLSETANMVPGEVSWFGIRLKSMPGWHTYWKLGGDSGEPTEATDWVAPEGTIIGQIRWPAPYWLPFPGSDLVNYGFEGEVLLPLPVVIPASYQGETVDFSTTVSWYVCELICIPGQHRLDLNLPVGEIQELDAAVAPLAAKTRADIPSREHDLEFIIIAAGERVSLGFQAPSPEFSDVVDAWFFPDRRQVIANGPIRDVTIQPNLIQITHSQPRRLLDDLSEVYGMLVVQTRQGDRRAYEFVDPAADANESTITPMAAVSGENADGSGSGAGFLVVLGFMAAALLGGVILNLMPCVFPVLSLKALTFAANAGESRQKQRMDGLVYTAGVVSTFLLLATILIALRAGGELVGWAFQLQAPWFVAILVFLFFALGMSLSGVFEIGTSFMSLGSDMTDRSHGYRRSFLTGALATVVASPCTAPFMGPALGFALTQTWFVAMLIFTALGVGMALPILLLSFIPVMVRFMPRPGKWMETFKEFMAFPLYLTALWLLWVLGNQVGVMGMAVVLGACILLAFAAWLFKQRRTAGQFWRTANVVLAVACLIAVITVFRLPFLTPLPAETVSLNADGSVNQRFEPFSTAKLAELRAAGKPVFVNMTAAWCITCLANEQTTLGSDRVHQAMLDHDITYLKGDWTNEDPEITTILNQFNRPSVPLYLLYSAKQNQQPEILPQILTPGIMLAAFARL